MSVKDKYVLAIDVGTTSVKVGILSLIDFEPLRVISMKSEILYPKKGWAEQDLEKLWQDILSVSRKLLDESKVGVHALVFDAHMAGVVPVDNEGNQLRNAIIWLDERASGLPRDLWGGVLKLQGYSIPKLIKFLRITGGAPSKTGKDVISKIIWLYENEPDIMRHTFKLLDIKGFLISKATGEFVTSHDEASLTWLADTRGGRAMWSDAILKDYGIERKLLPEIRNSTDIAGHTKGESREILGDIPVFVGAGDLTAAAVGSGAVREGEPHIYVGTSDWVAYHSSRRRVDVLHYVGSILSAIPGKYLFVGEQEVASGALEHMMRILGVQDYDTVNKLVREVKSTNLLFLPWFFGERAPIDDPTVRGGIINLSMDTSIGEILRAVMEGVALNIKWIYQYVAGGVREVNIVGGASLFDEWTQTIANALGVTLRRIRHPELAGLRGLATIVSVGMGVYRNFEEACSRFVIDKVFVPNKDEFERLNRKFKNFVKAYRGLKDVFKDLNSSYIKV